jgi:hypothetical protein
MPPKRKIDEYEPPVAWEIAKAVFGTPGLRSLKKGIIEYIVDFSIKEMALDDRDLIFQEREKPFKSSCFCAKRFLQRNGSRVRDSLTHRPEKFAREEKMAYAPNCPDPVVSKEWRFWNRLHDRLFWVVEHLRDAGPNELVRAKFKVLYPVVPGWTDDGKWRYHTNYELPHSLSKKDVSAERIREAEELVAKLEEDYFGAVSSTARRQHNAANTPDGMVFFTNRTCRNLSLVVPVGLSWPPSFL